MAGKDFAVFLPEHVLQHLPGQENAIILTGHVLRLRLEHGLGLFGARVPEFTGFVHNNRGLGARVLVSTDSGTVPHSGRQWQHIYKIIQLQIQQVNYWIGD